MYKEVDELHFSTAFTPFFKIKLCVCVCKYVFLLLPDDETQQTVVWTQWDKAELQHLGHTGGIVKAT